MTPKLPAASAKDLVRVAEKLGFVFRRQTGSHAIYIRTSDQARLEQSLRGITHYRSAQKRRQAAALQSQLPVGFSGGSSADLGLEMVESVSTLKRL